MEAIMQKAAAINLRIEPEIKTRLEKLAEATHRSKSFLMGHALESFLDANEWQIAEIKRGVAEIRDGQVTPHADVRTRWEAKVAQVQD
jgi:predicted transcriptional regulator